jgi:hypothetical protein
MFAGFRKPIGHTQRGPDNKLRRICIESEHSCRNWQSAVPGRRPSEGWSSGARMATARMHSAIRSAVRLHRELPTAPRVELAVDLSTAIVSANGNCGPSLSPHRQKCNSGNCRESDLMCLKGFIRREEDLPQRLHPEGSDQIHNDSTAAVASALETLDGTLIVRYSIRSNRDGRPAQRRRKSHNSFALKDNTRQRTPKPSRTCARESARELIGNC